MSFEMNRRGTNMNSSSSSRGGRSRNARRAEAFRLSGGRILPSTLPPVVVSQPWNSAVIMAQAAGSSSLKKFLVKDLKKFMKAQLGFVNAADTTLDFDVRIESISMWALSDDIHLVLYPADFVTKSGIELSRVESHSQRNAYARVGFQYPLHLSITPVSTATDALIAAFVTSAETTCEFHIKILWKGAHTALVTKHVRYNYVPLCRELRDIASHLEVMKFDEEDRDVAVDNTSDFDVVVDNIPPLVLDS